MSFQAENFYLGLVGTKSPPILEFLDQLFNLSINEYWYKHGTRFCSSLSQVFVEVLHIKYISQEGRLTYIQTDM